MPLKEGDIIELKKGHTVYAMIPSHFVYANRVGCFDLVQTEVPIDGNKNGLDTAFMAGEWVVVSTSVEGGGRGHGTHDRYPAGYKVTCVRRTQSKHEHQMKVSFYQTGSFTAMITDDEVQVIGQAEVMYNIKEKQ